MAESDLEIVLEFLRSNGFTETESALREDVVDKGELVSFDFQRFLLPIVRNRRRSFSEDEFLSLDSFFTTELKNHHLDSSNVTCSDTSSDILSEFGTAFDHHELDFPEDVYFQSIKDDSDSVSPEKRVNGNLSTCRFTTAIEVTEHNDSIEAIHKTGSFQNQIFLDKSCVWNNTPSDNDHRKDVYHVCEPVNLEDGVKEDSVDHNSCYLKHKRNHDEMKLKDPEVHTPEFNISDENLIDNGFLESRIKKNDEKDGSFGVFYHDCGFGNGEQLTGEPISLDAAAFHEENVVINEPSFCDDEDECEVFNLKIIHRKNRTGFEENKDFNIVLNSMMVGRYYIKEHLGSAAFSKVILAYDVHMGIDVCMKIIKNDKDCFDQSLDEVKLLKLVNKNDPSDECHILRLYDYFYFQEHLVITCELLGANLYELQRFYQDSGGERYFTIGRLQLIAQQCLEAIGFLGNLGIIHCDMKPENILIKNYESCEIKVIDLGSSCFETDNMCLYVQSRSYRAPEVILGLPYDQKIDIWSLGCILAELCSGEVLFPNDTLVNVLARMIGMFGQIDREMLEEGQCTNNYFTNDYSLFHLNEERDEVEYIRVEEWSLGDHLHQVCDPAFLDFITCLLTINPEKRPTATEALMHPWLSRPYPPLYTKADTPHQVSV